MVNQPEAKSAPKKRKYNSPLRQQQAAETRERIINAGSELVHEFPTWDWTNLTAKAVGDRAGVAERTVHRHFASERALRQAVLQRLVEESGISLEDFELKDFAGMTEDMLKYLVSFSANADLTPTMDPALTSIFEYRRRQLMSSVIRETPDWTDRERQLTAAALDVLWDPTVYGRIKSTWELDMETATRTITWMIDLIEQAIRTGNKP